MLHVCHIFNILLCCKLLFKIQLQRAEGLSQWLLEALSLILSTTKMNKEI
jgi:hypothetical protein